MYGVSSAVVVTSHGPFFLSTTVSSWQSGNLGCDPAIIAPLYSAAHVRLDHPVRFPIHDDEGQHPGQYNISTDADSRQISTDEPHNIWRTGTKDRLVKRDNAYIQSKAWLRESEYVPS